MLEKIAIVAFLIGVCVTIHSVGLILGMNWVSARFDHVAQSFGRKLRVLVLIALWTILLHFLEIAFWALFYVWMEAMPDYHAAFYFSAVTYTTTGYGDVVLPDAWRWISGIHALTGILLSGASTGFFFAVFSRIHGKEEIPQVDPGRA